MAGLHLDERFAAEVHLVADGRNNSNASRKTPTPEIQMRTGSSHASLLTLPVDTLGVLQAIVDKVKASAHAYRPNDSLRSSGQVGKPGRRLMRVLKFPLDAVVHPWRHR